MFRRMLTIAVVSCSLFVSVQAGTPADDVARKPDDWFGSDEGRNAMERILSWQTEHGDWPKNTDTVRAASTGDRSRLTGTFDNGATTGELRALARAYQAVEDARYKAAFLKGYDHILQAQYPHGGWPQYFPLRSGYYSHITFNDGSMIRLMEFLSDMISQGDVSLLDQDRVTAGKDALARGTDCILQCQVVVNGTPRVWCAQHDEVTFAPAKARSYELASLSGSESAGVLKYLMKLEEPSPEVIRCVKAGVAWFDSTKIKGVRIARVGPERRLLRCALPPRVDHAGPDLGVLGP